MAKNPIAKARRDALKSAKAAFAAKVPLTEDEKLMLRDSEAARASRNAALSEAAVSGLGGMASAALESILQGEEAGQVGGAGLPGASPGSVGHSGGGAQLSAGRVTADVTPRQSLALEMLRKGGYS